MTLASLLLNQLPKPLSYNNSLLKHILDGNKWLTMLTTLIRLSYFSTLKRGFENVSESYMETLAT